jgi:hypothetical protein
MSTDSTLPTQVVPSANARTPLATPTKNIFVETNMTAKITKYTIEKANNKDYVAYHIECRLRDLHWSVKKRYSECLTFHNRLSSTLVTKDYKIHFPPKYYTKSSNFNPTNIEKRLADLQKWFDAITSADSVWYTNYEGLIHDFLESQSNLAKIIADRCKVDVEFAKKKLSQYENFLAGLPDWNKTIEAILHDKTVEVMVQSGEDYQKARKALCENGHTVENAVRYLKNIQQIVTGTGLDRSAAVTLYYNSGSNVETALQNFKNKNISLTEAKQEYTPQTSCDHMPVDVTDPSIE